MSFDIQLAHACPHLTIEEEVPLGEDRRSLNTLQPVGFSNAVVIRANGVNIPREGLFSRAELSTGLSGPFNIAKAHETLTIRNRTQGITIQLPIGNRISTDRVVEVLNARFKNEDIQISAENRSGILCLLDFLESGGGSQIRVSGTAIDSLGYAQIRARGRKVYPAWDLAERPDLVSLAGLTEVKTITVRYPQFRERIRGNPVFTVTYRTFQNKCLRCQSTGIENTHMLSSTGDPLLVRNEDKLNQDVLKIITTEKGSNPYHPEYGSLLTTRIGLKAVSASKTLISEDVTSALRVLQRIQSLQREVQEVTPKETLSRVLSVNTIIASSDPTLFHTDIVTVNASNQPVSISTVFAAPGTAALAGSNGLSLGLEGLGLDPRTRTLRGVAVR